MMEGEALMVQEPWLAMGMIRFHVNLSHTETFYRKKQGRHNYHKGWQSLSRVRGPWASESCEMLIEHSDPRGEIDGQPTSMMFGLYNRKISRIYYKEAEGKHRS